MDHPTKPQTMRFAESSARGDTALPAEELARADLYGLLAELLYRAPDAALLHRIAAAPQQTDRTQAQSALTDAWLALAQSAAQTAEAEAADEYARLFLGIGKPEVFLYGSWYIAGYLNEQPLVRLRDDLAVLGLERGVAVGETEDHIAMLCEVMRYLIASDDIVESSLATQQRFFCTHLQPFATRLCETLAGHPQARFYADVARFAQAFFEVEAVGFEMA